MNNMALALRIREIREQKGYTQERVSEHLGISRQAYVRLEQGKRTISFMDIKMIADLFDIHYSEITDLKEVKEDLSLVSLCRDENNSEISDQAFQTVQHVLDVFLAQERLYYRNKESEEI